MTTSPGPPAPRAHRFLPPTAVAVVACALLMPAVAAGATWDTTTVANDGGVVARIDGTGAAEVVGGLDYFGGGPLLSSVTRPWHGPWSPATPIAELPVPYAPDVLLQQASNSTGDVVVLARPLSNRGDLVAYGRTRGVLLAPQVLTTGGVPNGAPERLVMNDAGEALVAWQSGGRVGVATRAPNGVWSAAVTLDRDAQPHGGATMDAALNEAGDALVVWRHRQRGPNALRSSQRVASGVWSMPRAFGGRQGYEGTTVALDETGAAVVAWHLVRRRVGKSTSKRSLWVAQKRWRSARWSPPQRLQSGVELLDFGLGIDAVGNAVAISSPTGIAYPPWWRPLRAWHRGPSGPWVSQAPPRNARSYIDLTVSRFGRAVALFGCDDMKGVRASVARLPGGSWSSARTLTAVDAACGDDVPQINDAGDAVVTWSELVGNTANPVHASALDGPATAETTSLARSGRRIVVGVSRPGRLLVSLRRPAARHLAAAFFVEAPVGTRSITLPTTAEGVRLAGKYVATVETGSRNPNTRSRSVAVTLAVP